MSTSVIGMKTLVGKIREGNMVVLGVKGEVRVELGADRV